VAGRVVGSDVEGEEKIAGGASIVARRNAQFVVVRRRPVAVWNITTNITTSSSSPSSCLLVPTQATAPEKNCHQRRTDRAGLHWPRLLPFITRCFPGYMLAVWSRRTPGRARWQLSTSHFALSTMESVYGFEGFDPHDLDMSVTGELWSRPIHMQTSISCR